MQTCQTDDDAEDGDADGYGGGDDDDDEYLSFPAKLLAGGEHLPVCQTEVGQSHFVRWSAGWKFSWKTIQKMLPLVDNDDDTNDNAFAHICRQCRYCAITT